MAQQSARQLEWCSIIPMTPYDGTERVARAGGPFLPRRAAHNGVPGLPALPNADESEWNL